MSPERFDRWTNIPAMRRSSIYTRIAESLSIAQAQQHLHEMQEQVKRHPDACFPWIVALTFALARAERGYPPVSRS